jgi:hypothetical protein
MIHWQIIVDFFAVIGTVTAVITLGMYLRERRKSRDQDILMLGFLHGIKPMIEGASQRDSAWKGFVQQINDMLSRFQPPKSS